MVDFLVIGAGSAGCVLAAELVRRDWAFRSAQMAAAGGRQINIPRGRMVGGLGSINSMGLFRDDSDLDTMVAGLERLRELLARADLGTHRAKEAFPGPAVMGVALREHIRLHAGTAYHPVGTLRMGKGFAPVSPRLAVTGVGDVWVADASVMPAVTSANTNAPSMMIGWKGAEYIVEDAA